MGLHREESMKWSFVAVVCSFVAGVVEAEKIIRALIL